MIGLKRNIYRFLVGLLIFGLFPLSLSAQKTTDDDRIIVEMVRPPMDSVYNIKEYEFEIIKDKETKELVVIVYDDDGTPVKKELSDDELKELGYIEDVRDLDNNKITGIDRLPDGSLILSYADDDGIIVKQEITPDDAIALGLAEPEDTAPEEVVPEDTTSKDIVPEGTAPEDVVSEDTVPEEVVSKDTTPKDELDSQKGDVQLDGDPLPATATSMYNYLALGALLVVIGLGLYIIQHIQRKGD